MIVYEKRRRWIGAKGQKRISKEFYKMLTGIRLSLKL